MATATFDINHLAGLTVVAVWAHPDDESYLAGGLMASVARSGGRVVNVTATLGEQGMAGPGAPSPERVASIRSAELAGALDELGVRESLTLGFRDGHTADVPTDLGVRRVSTVLDEIRPDLVVSFGADGVTGHPDHIAVGSWTARAVHESTLPPALLETAAGRAWPADLVEAMHDVNAFEPGFPHRRRRPEDLALPLDENLLDTKLAALGCHSSQIGPVHDRLGSDGYRRLASVEAFRPANPAALSLLAGRSRSVA